MKNQLLAADEERPVDQDKQQFVPGYLALFLWTHPSHYFKKGRMIEELNISWELN